MPADDIQRFARQLADWARSLIAHGRSPFRQVDTDVPVWTPEGDLTVPLLFWINRQSLQAGGLVFFPSGRDPDLTEALAAARALGQNTLITWDAAGLRGWRDGAAGMEPVWHRPLPPAPDIADFQQALTALMEWLKAAAVLGSLPPTALGAAYFANLLQQVRATLAPPLLEQARVHLAGQETLRAMLSAETLATHLEGFALTRLLGLAADDLLPGKIQPEGIERAMAVAASAYPPSLAALFILPSHLPPLPHSTCVTLHGLLHRLQQLGWHQDRHRALHVLEQLAESQASALGLPADAVPTAELSLWLNPGLPLDQSAEREWALCPSMLLLRALWRHWQDKSLPDWTLLPPEGLPSAPPDISRVRACLQDSGSPPTRGEARRLATLLRAVWPNRPWTLSSQTPAWAYRWLWLLGACPTDAQLEVMLPGGWLTQPWAQPLQPVLHEHFSLLRLQEHPSGALELTLVRRRDPDGHGELQPAQGPVRPLPLPAAPDQLFFTLHLGLRLPAPFDTLLADGQLVLAPVDADTEGLSLYRQSHWAQQLAQAARDLPAAWCLRPSDGCLQQLAVLARSDEAANSDTLLATLLGVSPPTAAHAPPPVAAARSRGTGVAPRTLEAALQDICARQGIPVFPGQYLYRLDNRELRHFHFTPPLTQTDAFFGEFTLTGSDGQALAVTGDSTREALLLASQLGLRQLELPGNDEDVAAMLQAYRRDLAALRQRLEQEALARCSDPRQARRAVDRLWREQLLPNPERLSPAP